MSESYKIRANNRLPFDFEDGIKVGGVDITNLKDLGNPGGSALVSYESGRSVQSVLDTSVALTDYTALRAYGGRATMIRITGDGIAGLFKYDATDTVSVDNGGTIIVAGSKRWKRVFENEINVFWFMTPSEIQDTQSRSPTMDHTLPVEKALSYAKSLYVGGFETSGGLRVRIPAGQYRVSKITRRSGVTIVGDGSRNTVIMPIPTPAPSGLDPEYGLLEIEDGPVSGSSLRGLTLSGSSTPSGTVPVNINQWGIYTRAKYKTLTATSTGGLWYSDYQDVWVRGFSKGEWSRAGYLSGTVNSLLPNQFILYDNVVVQVTAGGEARRFTGQHGQIAVRGGDNGGLDSTMAARAITCDWDPNPSQIAVNALAGESTSHVAGTGNAIRTPEQLEFIDGCGIQRSSLAVFVRNTRGVKFDNCWFESLGSCFDIQSSGGAIITNSRLANAADGLKLSTPVAGAGFIVQQGPNTNFEFGEGNVITGTLDKIYSVKADPLDNEEPFKSNINEVLRSKFSFSSRVTDGKTYVDALPTITTSADGSAVVNGNQYVLMRSHQADLAIPTSKISSMLAPGQTLTIRAWSGPLTLSNSGGNIRLGSNLPLVTIPDGGYVTLLRVHSTVPYTATSVEWIMQNRSDYTSDTLPIAGYHAEGTRIWKITQTPGTSPGWVCTASGIPGTFNAMGTLA